MHKTMHLRQGKQVGQSLRAAGDNSPRHRHLYMTDRDLIDTGSNVNVYPKTGVKRKRQEEVYQLYAAIGTVITTYGKQCSRTTPSLPVAIYCSQCDAADYRIRLPSFLSSSIRYAAEEINRWKNGTYGYKIRPREPNTVCKNNYRTNGILQNFGQIPKDRAIVGKTSITSSPNNASYQDNTARTARNMSTKKTRAG